MKTDAQITVAGIDEAGRGAWAGPVVAAALVLPKGTRLPGLKDSKQLSAQQREKLFDQIIKSCEFGVGMASHLEIDEFGLTKATFLAFERALNALPRRPNALKVDGRDPFHFDIPAEFIIRGDTKVRSISAASVLAKVTRDRWMVEAAKTHSNHSFELHKGYGTAKHQEALKTHGACDIHRKSYQPLKNLT